MSNVGYFLAPGSRTQESFCIAFSLPEEILADRVSLRLD